MQLSIYKFGRPVDSAYEVLASRLIKRISSFVSLESEVIPLRSSSEKTIKNFVVRLEKLPSAYIVGFDSNGKMQSSVDIAKEMEQFKANPAIKNLAFVIGAPYGIADSIRKQCDCFWSLGKGTYPSDLAWIMAIEQLYRALTIIAGSPYHHD